MSWRETDTGRFEREFDSIENFHRAVGGAGAPIQREHWKIRCIAQISPVPTKEELELAWKTLRNRHPLLAGVEEDGRYVYRVPDSSALESWVKETCFYYGVDDETTTKQVLSRTRPTKYMQLSLLAETREIVMEGSHWQIDGLGFTALTNELLDILANPLAESSLDWNSETTLPRLTPGVDELMQAPKEATPERLDKAKQFTDELFGNPATMAFKTLPNEAPGATGILKLILSEDETAKVIRGCKARGFTVSVGVHTALILAGQHFDDQKAQTEDGRYVYTDGIVISLRKFLPAPYNSGRVPVTNYHTGVPLTLDVMEESKARKAGTKALGTSSLAFSHVATELSEVYRRDTRNFFDFLTHFVKTVTGIWAMPPPPDAPPPPALPALSSLGILEDHLQPVYEGKKRIELTDWSLGLEMLDRHVSCHCWTYKKQLNLQATWNEGFYTHNFVASLVKEWKDILLRELA